MPALPSLAGAAGASIEYVNKLDRYNNYLYMHSQNRNTFVPCTMHYVRTCMRGPMESEDAPLIKIPIN